MTKMRFDLQHSQTFAARKWMAAASLVLLSHAGVVQALGLGRMKVLSHVGQPFSAEIDLINASRDDLAALKVNLAPPAAYEAANLRFDPSLNALRLSLQKRANGAPYIRATTLRPVSEPYLDVLVEVTGQDVKLKRTYSALLDLPELVQPSADATAAPGTPVAAAPAARPEALPPRTPAASRAPRRRATAQAAAPAPEAPASAAPAVRPAEVAKEPAKTTVAQAIPATAETTRAESAAPDTPTPAAPAASAEPAATQTAPAAAEPPTPAQNPAEFPVAAKPAPATAPVASTAPQPPRGGGDSGSNLWLWIGGALAALLALVAGLWVWRRRSESPFAAIEPAIAVSHAPAPVVSADPPHLAPVQPAAVAAAAATPAADHFDVTASDPTVASVTDMVDPLDEARVHLEYGQTEQAETILREALNREPGREDILLQLLEILAQRGDTDGFNQLAGRVHKQTGGLGDAWKRVMTMGYALDPDHALYSPTAGAAPRSAAVAPPPASDADDLQLEDRGNSIDMEKTLVLVRPGATPAPAPAPVPAAVEPLPDINFELPPASVPAAAVPATPAVTAAQDHPGLDFKVDLPGIVDVKLDDAPRPAADAPVIDVPAADAPAADALREEVEKKLLLARAYREMGDKEGALELLREVEREGDATQLAEMRELVQSLTP